MISPLASLLLALPALSVSGESTCPAPDEVAERVAKLLEGIDARTVGHQASLTQLERAVVVELRDERGALIGHRTLRAATCAGLAQGAAAVLMAWEANLPSHTRELPAAPPRRPVGSFATGEGTAPPDSPPTGSELALRIDAGGAIATSGGSVRAGGSLGLAGGFAESPARALIAVHAAAPFQTPLGPGQVRWSRPALAVGFGYRLLDGAVPLDLGMQLLAAMLFVRGVGYQENASARDFDPGVSAAVRASWRAPGAQSLSAWLELAGTLHPRGESVQVGGINEQWGLPPVAIDLRAGLSLDLLVKGFPGSGDSPSP